MVEVRTVVGVAGMPGAGKATFSQIIKKMGCSVIVMGDVIREEADRRNLTPTLDNLGQIMLELRETEGPSVVAQRCIAKIKTLQDTFVLIDGVRSLSEVSEFKKVFPQFILTAIHTSPKTRFQRLSKRNRSDDPLTWETFIQRDFRELKVGLGDVIATADYMIINEGEKRQLRRKIRRLVERVIKT